MAPKPGVMPSIQSWLWASLDLIFPLKRLFFNPVSIVTVDPAAHFLASIDRPMPYPNHAGETGQTTDDSTNGVSFFATESARTG